VSQTGIDVRGLKPTAILPRIENCEMSTHQVEGNRDLEIATCPANHPENPQPLQSRFLKRGSFPKLADSQNLMRVYLTERFNFQSVHLRCTSIVVLFPLCRSFGRPAGILW
jgi:hypothetical protein